MRRPATAEEIHTGWANEVPNLDPLVDAPCAMSGMERLALFSLAAGTRPRNYLEIGSYRGGSALIVTHAMNVSGNADGRLTLIDPWETDESWKVSEIDPEVWVRISSRTTRIKARSPEAVNALHREFNMALIDGEHTEEAALADLRAVWNVLLPDGIVLVHDWRMASVRSAVEQFQKETSNLIPFGLVAEDHKCQMGLWLGRKWHP